MIAGIQISQEIFAIDVLTALNPLWSIVGSMFCDCYDYMETRLKDSVLKLYPWRTLFIITLLINYYQSKLTFQVIGLLRSCLVSLILSLFALNKVLDSNLS